MFIGFGIYPICSCYAAEILANHKLEKEKKIVRVFSKQYGIASQLGISVGYSAHLPLVEGGGGVSG